MLLEVRTKKSLRSSKQGLSEAGNCLAIVRRCLRWAKRTVNPETRARYVAEDVSADIASPTPKGSRERVLNENNGMMRGPRGEMISRDAFEQASPGLNAVIILPDNGRDTTRS
jgi:hypothetical protein